MSGHLNINIIQAFKIQFEENCISLLLDSYNSIPSKSDLKELTENNITARLIGFIKDNPLRKKLNITINREAYNDTETIYSGLVDADESPRIDMKYTVWNMDNDYDYFMEAKNLSENNWKKSTVTTPINAKELQKRYISTGIQNFITGRYPNGCLIGYITEGDPDTIATNINSHLTLEKRAKEHLSRKADSLVPQYSSTHTGTKMIDLKHYFLKFN